jgi:hypothetical protein
VLRKSPFVGKGTLVGVEFSFRYTIGYNTAKGQGANVSLIYRQDNQSHIGCPNTEPATTSNDYILWTSPSYIRPEFDKVHNYSAPVPVNLSALEIDIMAPGRLGLRFEGNDHNMQILLPIELHLTWGKQHSHQH